MGAETLVYVRVLKTYDEWIEVSAMGLQDAMAQVAKMPGVVGVLEASYEPGGIVT